MMTGCIDGSTPRVAAGPRVYDVVARGGGWSIRVNGACTRPFASRSAAYRIARLLQRQADALSGRHRKSRQ